MGSLRIAGRARSILLLLIGLLAGQGLAAEPGLFKGLLDQSSIGLQVLAYDSEFGLREDSLLNPGNRIVVLPNGQTDLEARLDLKLTTDHVVLSLKPRARFDWMRFEDDVSKNRLDAFVNQWSVMVTPVQDLAVSVGRDILTWGPSNFRSPSNPIYFENGRNNPIRELLGVDVTKVTYSPATDFSLALMHTFGDGRGHWQWDKEGDFKALSLLKLDYIKDIHAGSLIISKLWNDERPRFGAWWQTTASDALLVYAEAGLRQGTPALYPQALPSGFGGGFLPRHANDDQLSYSALVGGGYTFDSGHTLYLEYLNNNEGYQQADQERYFNIAASASDALANSSPASPMAAQTLGTALNNGLALQGRHYLFLQLQNNQTDTGPTWQLRYTFNMVDGSGQASAYIEWNAMSRLTLFAVGMVNHGSRRSEFNSLLSRSILVGAKGFIW